MRDFVHTVRFKILVALLTVMAGFMIAAIYTGGSAPLVGQIVSFVTVPIQKASASISGGVSEFFGKYLSAGQVYEENQTLRQEVNELRQNLIDYEKAKHENEQFREILGVMDDRRDLTIETASVIARDPANRFSSFTIDKGSMDNIRYLDPVITADGLVGYVSEVGMTYSKVITILDVTIDVGAYDSATRDIGIVTGTIELAEEGLCQMEYLPRDSQIKEGDLILTSGGSVYATQDAGGSLYPRDIVVGKVREVRLSSHGTSLIAIVEPAADPATVKNVFVVTYFEGQYEVD